MSTDLVILSCGLSASVITLVAYLFHRSRIRASDVEVAVERDIDDLKRDMQKIDEKSFTTAESNSLLIGRIQQLKEAAGEIGEERDESEESWLTNSFLKLRDKSEESASRNHGDQRIH